MGAQKELLDCTPFALLLGVLLLGLLVDRAQTVLLVLLAFLLAVLFCPLLVLVLIILRRIVFLGLLFVFSLAR